MKLRNYFYYSEGNYTFTVKKQEESYNAPYDVVRTERATTCSSKVHKTTLKEWKMALKEIQRQLRIYTSLSNKEIRELR